MDFFSSVTEVIWFNHLLETIYIYILLTFLAPCMQVRGWMRSLITGFENEAAEFGLERMRQTHSEATVVCKKKFASLDESIKVSFMSPFISYLT